MKNSTINLRDLVILVADPNSYLRRVINGMLRGFGANKVMEVEQSLSLFQALSSQKIDILLCDTRLPPHGGLKLTRTIRRNADNENRTMPILLMSSDTSEIDDQECARRRRQYGGRKADVAQRASTIGSAGSPSIRAPLSTPRPISDRTGASRSKAIRAASAAARATSQIEVAEEVGTGPCAGRHRQSLQRCPYRTILMPNKPSTRRTFSMPIPASSEWRGAPAASRASRPWSSAQAQSRS